jgi:hypothetical protein
MKRKRKRVTYTKFIENQKEKKNQRMEKVVKSNKSKDNQGYV